MPVAAKALNELLAGQTLSEEELEEVFDREDLVESDMEVLGFNAFIVLD